MGPDIPLVFWRYTWTMYAKSATTNESIVLLQLPAEGDIQDFLLEQGQNIAPVPY